MHAFGDVLVLMVGGAFLTGEGDKEDGLGRMTGASLSSARLLRRTV